MATFAAVGHVFFNFKNKIQSLFYKDLNLSAV